jgi:type I restriction enzyme S subunit
MTATTIMESARPFRHTAMRPVGDFAVKSRGSVDPSRYPDEVFELFSIPAYDLRKPEVLHGSEIGSAKKVVAPGDVLISRIVPHIQRVWVVGPSNGHRQIASGEWIVFGHSETDPDYLRHMLLSKPFHDQFMQTVAGMGGSLLRARPSEVERIEIPVPSSRTEQRRIAAILDKADAIRRKRERALTLADDFLRSAYLTIVGLKHPGYENWEPVAIESLAADKRGSIRSGPFGSALLHSEFVDEGIAVLGIDNAVKNKFQWAERRFITTEKYEELRRYRVFPNDVIITIMGTTGRSAVVPDDIPEAITTKHLASITCDRQKILPEVLSFAIHSDPVVIEQIRAANKGAIMDGLNLGIIRQIKIRKPPLDQQRLFVNVLKKTYAAIQRMAAPTVDGSDLFLSLSQRAFRGEL